MTNTTNEIIELVKNLSDESRKLIPRIIDAETNKLHMKNPIGISFDLQKIIEDAIQ